MNTTLVTILMIMAWLGLATGGYTERMTRKGTIRRDRRSNHGSRQPRNIMSTEEIDRLIATGNTGEWHDKAWNELRVVRDLMEDADWHAWIDPVNLGRLTWREIYELVQAQHVKLLEEAPCAS